MPFCLLLLPDRDEIMFDKHCLNFTVKNIHFERTKDLETERTCEFQFDRTEVHYSHEGIHAA
jgi:hypothetical protein